MARDFSIPMRCNDGQVHVFSNQESALTACRYRKSEDITLFEYTMPDEAKMLAQSMPPAISDAQWEHMKPIFEHRVQEAVKAAYPDMAEAPAAQPVTAEKAQDLPLVQDAASADMAKEQAVSVSGAVQPAADVPTQDDHAVRHDISGKEYRYLGNWTGGNFHFTARDGKDHVFSSMEAAYQACKTADSAVIDSLAKPGVKGSDAARIGSDIQADADFETHKQDYADAVVHAKVKDFPWMASQLSKADGTFFNSNKSVDPVWAAAINREHEALRATVAVSESQQTQTPAAMAESTGVTMNTMLAGRPMHDWMAEYLYARAIADVNEANVANQTPLLTSRLARQLRKDCESDVAAISQALHTGDQAALHASVSAIMKAAAKAQDHDSPLHVSDADIADWTYVFNSYLKEAKSFNEAWAPISPYDPAVSDLEMAMVTGSHTLFVKAGTLQKAGVTWTKDGIFEYAEKRRRNPDTPDLKLYTMKDVQLLGKDGRYESHPEYLPVETPLVTTMDRLGFTGLSQSLTRKEYKAVSDAVSTGLDIDKFAPAKPEDVQKAAHILDWLRSHGMSYEITTNSGEYGAQVVAAIEGTHYAVTLTNPARSDTQYQSYIGRVYDSVTARSTYVTTGGTRGERAVLPDFAGQEVMPLEYIFGKPISADLGVLQAYTGKTQLTNRNGSKGTVLLGVADGIAVGIHTELQSTALSEHEVEAIDLPKALESARTNFASQVGLDGLISEYQRQRDAGQGFTAPVFSDDENVAGMQDLYWRYLTTDGLALKKPDHYQTTSLMEAMNFDEDFDDSGMTKEEAVRAHFATTLDSEFGTYTDDEVRISPKYILLYMDGGKGTAHDKEKALFKAIHDEGLSMKELIGGQDEFENIKAINNGLLFDPAHAHLMRDDQSPLIQAAYHKIVDTLKSTAGVVEMPGTSLGDSIQIDRNGVVKYKVYVATKKSLQFDRTTGESYYNQNGERIYTGFKTFNDVWNALKSNDPVQVEHAKQYIRPVTGYIGQIFDYDPKLAADGIKAIRTRYPAGSNALLVPGYTAEIVPDKPGYRTNPAARTVCFGYEDHLMTRIGATIRRDIESYVPGKQEIGTAYSMDDLYRKLYDEKFPLDYMKESAYGRTQTDKKTILQTLSRKIKFDQRYQEGADVINANQAEILYKADPCNDNFSSAARELNYTCVNRISEDFAGYTSLYATSTAQNIGLVRFLTEGASVDPETRRIHPSMKDGRIDVDDETPAMKNPRFRSSQYDAADRIQKAFNDYMTALNIAKDVGFAMVDTGGWTMDDGYVVSKAFASKYRVPDERWNAAHPDDEPRFRPLEVGDKISDCHGNKGTISLVVDPDLDDRLAAQRGMADVVRLFRANPALEVAGAAYPGISRQNGGTYYDGHEQPMDLVDPRTGTVLKNHACRTEFGILSQTADRKSKIYGRGEGRTISSQLSWILSAEKLSHTMDEFFGRNLGAAVGLRELLNVLGGDLDEVGQIGYGIKTQPGESRFLFSAPEITDAESAKAFLGAAQGETAPTTFEAIDKACDKFLAEISKRGGYLVVPEGLHINAYLDACRPKDNFGHPVGQCFPKDEQGRTLLPVMGPALRAGTELYDGTVSEHDYTRYYRMIYRVIVQYQVDKYQMEHGCKLTGEPIRDISSVRTRVEGAQKKLQSVYAGLASRIYEDQLKPGMKHSYWKDTMMSRKAPQSATMVMTANPSLNIGELGMSFDSAKKLGYFTKDIRSLDDAVRAGQADRDGRVLGDGALTWRDPTLRSGAVRYMTVRVLPGSMKGVSINPFADKSYDGDFDGDQLGIVHAQTPEANAEMKAKISYAHTLLDESSPYPCDDSGNPTAQLKVPSIDQSGHVAWHDAVDCSGKPVTFEYHELFFNHALDVISGEAAKPELEDVYKDIEARANYWHETEERDRYMECAAKLIAKVEKVGAAAGIDMTRWGEDLSGVTAETFKKEHKDLKTSSPAAYREVTSLLTRLDANRAALLYKGLKPDPSYQRQFPDAVYHQAGQQLVKELSAYTHACYQASCMNNSISFGSMDDHLQTVAKYVNEGCKGKPSKLVGYMKALGVSVATTDEQRSPCINTDANKHVDISSLTFGDGGEGILRWIDAMHSTGFTAEDKQDQQQANATKSCLTGEAGAQSQHGMAALRNSSPKEVLALTYYVTQSVLQVKHSAEEAKQKTQLLDKVVTALWQGRKIEKVGGEWRVALREAPQFEYVGHDGRKHISEEVPKGASEIRELPPILKEGEKATPAEWKQTFKDFYTDEDGMNVGPLSDRFVTTVTKGLESLTRNTMAGVSSDELMKTAALMDILAYEKKCGRMTDGSALQNILRGHDINTSPLPLYTSRVGGDHHAYMPRQIRDNLIAAGKGLKDEIVPILAKECQVGYQQVFHPKFAGLHKKPVAEPSAEAEQSRQHRHSMAC